MTPPTVNQMTCHHARRMFSAYLDGAVSGIQMQLIRTHLDACSTCHAEFEGLRQTQRLLASTGTAKAPADLALRLRVAISHESSRRAAMPWEGLGARWENMLRPLLVQASAGLAGAVLLIGSLATILGIVAVPQAVQAHDVPLGASSQPHYLYSQVAPRPVRTTQETTIVIQADINAQGRVYDYAVLSGPSDPATMAQIQNELMLQVYEPAHSFGLPVSGRVLFTFAGVLVRG